ncbi:MarR family transcriptional regulator [Streptomyces sp. NPDC059166]|uniref:MarR family transcriptional regulator n=1 Tax=Streptomyces sp. NPDC059166 TaxID=3346752 RepID=UPI0036BB3F56
MATKHLSSASQAPARSRPYPMAHPGYGKRSAPDQQPRAAADFELLPVRERSIAAFIDRLPDGAAMDVKGLAKQLPLYGQQAVASALKALSVAGYLRRVRCLVGGEGGPVRWVFRTFWSRTARDNEWWAALIADTGDGAGARPGAVRAVPAQRAPGGPVGAETVEASASAAPEPVAHASAAPEPVASVPAASEPASVAASVSVPAPEVAAVPAAAVVERQGPSEAFLALARLGQRDARLGLSEADCAVLEPLAAEWLARGADAARLTQALTAGLPASVDSPVGFVRRRLNDKMPPRLQAVAAAPEQRRAPVRRAMLECVKCGVPGRAEALPDGLCRPCRQPAEPVTGASTDAGTATAADAGAPADRDVKAYVAGLRELLALPE